MADSLALAKLTVMLLRASIPVPDSLGDVYGVVFAPGRQVLPLSLALQRISTLKGLLTFGAEQRGRNLVITFEKATPEDEVEVTYRIDVFERGWRILNPRGDPEALVEVRGFHDALVVPVSVVQEWLRFATCRGCSLTVSAPLRDSPAGVIAVLVLGDQDKDAP